MSNSWTKKNPFLSMALSGVNAWAGAARGVVTGAVRRQQSAAINRNIAQAAAFWTASLTPMASHRRSSRKKR